MTRNENTEWREYMDWQFITRHLFCGCIAETAGLMLYFAVTRLSGKRQTFCHAAASCLLCFYFAGILTMAGVCIRGEFSPETAWIPFADMIKAPLHAFLNILLLVPAGIFLPLMYEEFQNASKTAFAGFLISLSVEIAQMFGSGTSDINDLIANTAGAYIGYCIYKLVSGRIPEQPVQLIRMKGTQGYRELLFFWAGSLMIMLTVQISIYRFLFPA